MPIGTEMGGRGSFCSNVRYRMPLPAAAASHLGHIFDDGPEAHRAQAIASTAVPRWCSARNRGEARGGLSSSS